MMTHDKEVQAVPSIQKSLRIRDRTVAAIKEIAAERDTDFSTVANDLLEQGTRMHRCPGIVFADGPAGPRSRVEGTGIEVWEIIATYRSLKRNWKHLREAYPHLSESQLRAALNYYRHYKEETDRRIARDEAWTPQKVRARYPFLTARSVRV